MRVEKDVFTPVLLSTLAASLAVFLIRLFLLPLPGTGIIFSPASAGISSVVCAVISICGLQTILSVKRADNRRQAVSAMLIYPPVFALAALPFFVAEAVVMSSGFAAAADLLIYLIIVSMIHSLLFSAIFFAAGGRRYPAVIAVWALFLFELLPAVKIAPRMSIILNTGAAAAGQAAGYGFELRILAVSAAFFMLSFTAHIVISGRKAAG